MTWARITGGKLATAATIGTFGIGLGISKKRDLTKFIVAAPFALLIFAFFFPFQFDF